MLYTNYYFPHQNMIFNECQLKQKFSFDLNLQTLANLNQDSSSLMKSSFDSDYFIEQTNLNLDQKTQSTLDTERSYNSNHDNSPLESELEIDVKPRKKLFQTQEEKLKFVEEYQKKYKTEMCKNWEFKGFCKYGDKCCYAHGQHELRIKTHLNTSYKTKPCKKYFLSGQCPYGNRCQYIHSDIRYYKEFYPYYRNVCLSKNLSMQDFDFLIKGLYFGYEKALKIYTNIKIASEQNLVIKDEKQYDVCNRLEKSRLPIFNELSQSKSNQL